MSETLREINLTPEFLNGLAAIQTYQSQFDAAKGRQLSSAIVDFACDIIGPFPQAYPKHPVPQHPDREYRRAIFRRSYVLIYRVTATEVSFLVIYNTNQNPSGFSLPD
jgi:hypothetical protein